LYFEHSDILEYYAVRSGS